MGKQPLSGMGERTFDHGGERPADPPMPAFDVLRPQAQRAPVVFTSPHSGRLYPSEFLAASALDPLVLRRAEDSFVDDLFEAAPGLGAPLLACRYARVFLDVNREPFELDPAMFEDDLPAYTNTTSLRVAGGLGTIPRVVADGAEVYRAKLRYAEAEQRVRTIYYPYHRALQGLLDETRRAFGMAVLIDCHSMPSLGTPQCPGGSRPDIVLGDRYGTTCAPSITAMVQSLLERLGFQVARNTPYAGGYTTYHYGRPALGVHALQIEINRALYMDEARIRPSPSFAGIRQHMTTLTAAILDWTLHSMCAPR